MATAVQPSSTGVRDTPPSDSPTRVNTPRLQDTSESNHPHLTAVVPPKVVEGAHKVSSLARRIHGWGFNAFPIGMGTGAVYICLAGIPYNVHVLHIIVHIFFWINVFIYIVNVLTLTAQAILYPRQSWRLIRDPSKGVFVPLMVLSLATVIIGIVQYVHVSVSWRPDLAHALYWMYVGLSVIVCFPMLLIWFSQPHELVNFSPTWTFLVFPMMLAGTVAFNVLAAMDPADSRTIGVLISAYIFQGLGFFMTFIYICIYIVRIMTTGFLSGDQATGAFVACGPPGFTAIALLSLGEHSRTILPMHNMISPLAGEIFYGSSVLAALLLFGLAVFFFVFGALPYGFKVSKRLSAIVATWALTFPNVGWIAALQLLADALHIHAFEVAHTVMAVAMCITWLVLVTLTVLAFVRGKIFFDDPDAVLRDEHHHRQQMHAPQSSLAPQGQRPSPGHRRWTPALAPSWRKPSPQGNRDVEKGAR